MNSAKYVWATFDCAPQFCRSGQTAPGTSAVAERTNTPAEREAVNYTLTVNVTGSRWGYVSGYGIRCPGDCSQSHAAGTTVWIAQVETMGDFAGWRGCDSIDGTFCLVKMNRSRSVHATFQRAS